MSELPRSSKYRSRPGDPVSDDERNDLSARLNDAFARGELTQQEYDERLDRLFAARTLGDLVPVVEAVGPRQTYRAPAIVEQSGGSPGQVSASRNAVAPAALVTVGVVALALLAVVVLLVLLL